MAEPGDVLKLSDLVIAGCTLIGPVLAVQAQKWVERFRDNRLAQNTSQLAGGRRRRSRGCSLRCPAESGIAFRCRSR
jgi:hypothetical protein